MEDKIGISFNMNVDKGIGKTIFIQAIIILTFLFLGFGAGFYISQELLLKEVTSRGLAKYELNKLTAKPKLVWLQDKKQTIEPQPTPSATLITE